MPNSVDTNRPHVSDEAVEALETVLLSAMKPAFWEDRLFSDAFDMRALEAALSLPHPAGGDVFCGEGFVFFNEDTGTEYSRSHPVESGECPNAKDIRKSTVIEDALWEKREPARIQSALEPDREPVEGEAGAISVETKAELAEIDAAMRRGAEIGHMIVGSPASPPVARDPGREAGLEEAARTAFNALTYPVSSEIDSRGYSLRIDRNEIAFAAETLHHALAATATSPEAVPQPSGSEGEWIEWHGGECPVPPETRVQVKFRLDQRNDEPPVRAAKLRWNHNRTATNDGMGDIVAYRRAGEPRPTPSEVR